MWFFKWLPLWIICSWLQQFTRQGSCRLNVPNSAMCLWCKQLSTYILQTQFTNNNQKWYSTDRKKVTIIAVSLSCFRFLFILADTLRLPLRELQISVSRILVWLLTFSDWRFTYLDQVNGSGFIITSHFNFDQRYDFCSKLWLSSRPCQTSNRPMLLVLLDNSPNGLLWNNLPSMSKDALDISIWAIRIQLDYPLFLVKAHRHSLAIFLPRSHNMLPLNSRPYKMSVFGLLSVRTYPFCDPHLAPFPHSSFRVRTVLM